MDNILSVEQSTISSQDLPKYGYVYVTENLINHKKYIGAHKASCFDENYKGSGKILWRAINKYGWDNFRTTIVKWCYSKEELFLEEYNEINRCNAVQSSIYYNVMPGGHGGDNKSSLSDEEYKSFVDKIKKSKQRPRTEKEVSHMKRLHESQVGVKRSKECVEKIRCSNLGQKRSEETCRKLSENHADVRGKNNPFYGKHHTEESLKKISDNHSNVKGELNPMYGKKHSIESKLRMSESRSKISKGRIWMTNKVDEEHMITPSEYDDYIKQGYVRGRLRKSQKLKLGR